LVACGTWKIDEIDEIDERGGKLQVGEVDHASSV
jgi:hypothetical protein